MPSIRTRRTSALHQHQGGHEEEDTETVGPERRPMVQDVRVRRAAEDGEEGSIDGSDSPRKVVDAGARAGEQHEVDGSRDDDLIDLVPVDRW